MKVPSFLEGKMQFVVLGTLGVIIIGSLIMSIKTTIAPNRPDPKDTVVRHFRCLKCNGEFDLTTRQIIEANKQAQDPVEYHVKCVQCNEPNAAVVTVQCPKCKKYWVPNALLPDELEPEVGDVEVDETAPAKAEAGDFQVCPHCGTHRGEFLKAQRKLGRVAR